MSMERQSRFRPLRAGHYAVVDGAHKLIWHLDTNRVELYDLASDALERDDLSARHPQVVTRLKALLEQRLKAAEVARPATLAPAP
jgi:arylsulfatase A-like enzyme